MRGLIPGSLVCSTDSFTLDHQLVTYSPHNKINVPAHYAKPVLIKLLFSLIFIRFSHRATFVCLFVCLFDYLFISLFIYLFILLVIYSFLYFSFQYPLLYTQKKSILTKKKISYQPPFPFFWLATNNEVFLNNDVDGSLCTCNIFVAAAFGSLSCNAFLAAGFGSLSCTTTTKEKNH